MVVVVVIVDGVNELIKGIETRRMNVDNEPT